MKLISILSIMALVLAALFAGQNVYADSKDTALSGKVVETMDSGGYTYVCLEKKGKKTWVAVPQMKVKRGRTCLFSPAPRW